MDLSQQDIFFNDLRFLSEDLGLINRTSGVNATSPIMCGDFRHITFPDGLAIHSIDAIEKQHTNSSMELGPCLSFNFIFQGQVHYSFGGKKYLLGQLTPNENIECSAIVNNTHEMLSRQMQAEMPVRKLNIYVEKHWLINRFQSKNDLNRLSKIFSHQGIYHWEPGKQTLSHAYQLFTSHCNDEFTGRLELESQTVHLLSLCIEELQKQTLIFNDSQTAPETKESFVQEKIDQVLEKHHKIKAIATALNMSTSTLQRKIKARYDMNASAYIKQWKLERAKKALILEDMSIGEAAFLTGYNHTSNFITAFKQNFGLTPKEYIKVHSNKYI